MKYTEYFLFTRKRADRASIKNDWIEYVIENYIYQEIQSDGRIKRWGFIEEQNRFLRVVLLEDGETVHNAFFDRDFRKRKE